MKSNLLNITLIQYAIAENQPELNVKNVLLLIKKSFSKKPDIIVLPETVIGTPSSKKCHVDYVMQYSTLIDSLRDLAQKHHVCFYGSFLTTSPKSKPHTNNLKFFNTALWINEQGKISGRYNKLHLFRFHNEHHRFMQGTKSEIFTTRWGKIAPQICYDIRFPELMRHQTFAGAQMAFVCAQWPQSRREHFLALLTARAIENQIFVVACNRTGTKDKLVFSGDSCVISPWGELLLHLKKNQSLGTCQIDLNRINQVRQKFPFLKSAHRKNFCFDL